jgi:hypothetical protein
MQRDHTGNRDTQLFLFLLYTYNVVTEDKALKQNSIILMCNWIGLKCFCTSYFTMPITINIFFRAKEFAQQLGLELWCSLCLPQVTNSSHYHRAWSPLSCLVVWELPHPFAQFKSATPKKFNIFFRGLEPESKLQNNSHSVFCLIAHQKTVLGSATFTMD